MRKAGILLAVSSLPSRHGVGDFGPNAYAFIDQLKATGASWWQVLPLNPLGYGNSPYQPYSSKAMDELYISLDLLIKEKLIEDAPDFLPTSTKVDYDAVRNFKHRYFRQAFQKFIPDATYTKFIEAQPWVEIYAVFMAFKVKHQLQMWTLWSPPFKHWISDRKLDLRPYQEEIRYQMFLQFKVYQQFIDLKRYVNEQQLKLVGDIPIYVGIDSIDVWMHQDQFMLTAEGEPTHVAGVPPDYFSLTGQRWGNPLYRWDVMEKNNFSFWIDRLAYVANLFDVLRIDHFRAFDTYWKIPSTCPTAVEGDWIEAPGYALFDTIKKQLPHLDIIAEDLGDLRPEVLMLRDHYHLPGMKIMQFALPIYPNGQGVIEPPALKKETAHFIAYTGTHDNQTTMGWYQGLTKQSQVALSKFIQPYQGTIAEKMVQLSLQSPYDVVVIPMQDILSLDDLARMNVPGTIGSPNWEWKMKDFKQFDMTIQSLKSWIVHAKRNQKDQ